MKIKFTLLILGIVNCLWSCKNDRHSISPEVKNITESVYAPGVVKSKNQYEVFSKANCILEKIYVKEGMRIKKGDPLFQLENKNSKFITDNARLAFETNAYASNYEKLKDADNAVQLANKKLVNDSLLYTRQRNLWNNNIGTRIEFELRELNFENSKVALEHSKTIYNDLKRQIKFMSGQSENNLQVAESAEEDFIIKSKVDGIVYKINKQEGELVTNMAAIAVIGEEDFMIELNVDEFDITKIKPQQQIIVRMDSYKSQTFEAFISAIYPIMSERTRTFKADAFFSKKPQTLYPNLTLEANIVIQTKRNVLTIPRNYLLNDSLVVLENGIIQKVKTGLMDYSIAEIESGLNSSSKIILPQK